MNKIERDVTLNSTLTQILSQTLTLALILNLGPTSKPNLAVVSEMIDTFDSHVALFRVRVRGQESKVRAIPRAPRFRFRFRFRVRSEG